MAKRKPKPLTTGEKIFMRQYGFTLHELRRSPASSKTAAAIDRAIARAVKRERKRCLKCVLTAEWREDVYDAIATWR